jgi:Transposase DDE domain group 1
MFLGKKEAALAMTECSQSSFGFGRHFSRAVVGRFDGGQMTSDAGALLLLQTDRRINLLSRLAACFRDGRSPWLIQHTVPEMVAQRIYGLALGYEDVSDHDQLRQDPLFSVLSGKPKAGEKALAGKSTLNRLEFKHGAAQPLQKDSLPAGADG